MKKYLSLVLLLMLSVTVGCGEGLTDIISKQTTAVATTIEHVIANDEYAILYNGRIYYSYSQGFFTVKTNGRGKKKLTDVFATQMKIADGRFIFINRSERGYIFSMNIDGSGLRQLNSDSPWQITVLDNWIYYNISRNSSNDYSDDGMGLFKMRIDGSERQRLVNEVVYHFDVVGDTIYYEASNRCFSVDTEGENRKPKACGWSVPTQAQQFRYFVGAIDGKIYSSRNDGSDLRQLSDDEWIILFGGPVLSLYPIETYYIFAFRKE